MSASDRRRGARGLPALALFALALFALAGVWSALLARDHLAGRATWLDRLEHPLLDLRFLLAGPRPAPDGVVVVAIDDAAIREAGAYPLPREALARLVRAVARAGPSAIGLDVLLLDGGRESADAALEAALRESPAVVAGAAVFARAARPGPGPQPAERVLRPLPRFADAAAVGLVNVGTDHGGVPRHLPLLIAEGDGLSPGFALRVAASARPGASVLSEGEVRLGGVGTRLDLGLNLPLRFYGPRGSIRTLGAGPLLRGTDDASERDAERDAGRGAERDTLSDILHDRIVVVGATAVGTADTFATPYDPVLPGVEVLATGVAHLTAGDGLVRDGRVRRVDAAAAAGLALGAAALLAFAPPAPAAGLIGAGVGLWLAATVAAFASGLWLSATMPLAALAPVAAFGLGGRLVLDRREARRLARAEQALRSFHPEHLAARIARDPAFLAEPMMQAAGVVFLDLTGFTGLSERLGARGTQGFLKDFHGVVEACVRRHGGSVVTFMGDGAMCVFGLAAPDADDARRALAAALDLVPRVRAWLAGRPEDVGGIDLRVGGHHGEVVVSRLGSAAHQHITATGDCVNTASRLMEVGKSLGAALVVSRDLLAAAGRDRAGAEPPFEGRRSVAIRGRVQPLCVAYAWARSRPVAGLPGGV